MALNSLKRKSQVAVAVVLVGSLLVMINFLASRHFVRWDLTADNEYTLSESSIQLLKKITDKVTIRLYISSDLPPTLGSLRQGLYDKLAEYKNYGGDRISIEVIHPDQSPQAEQQAQMMGIPPLQLDVIAKDKREVQKAYVGMGLIYLDKKEVIPVVSDLASLEYDITSAILKMTSQSMPRLGLYLPGEHQMEYSTVQQILEKNHEVVPVTADDTNLLEKNLSLLVLIQPKQVPPSMASQIDLLLESGVSVFIMGGRVQIGQNLTASNYDTGLEDWLAGKGLILSRSLVADPHDHTYAAFSNGLLQYHVPYHFFVKVPATRLHREHAVTSRLESLVFPWTNSLGVNREAQPEWRYEILAESSPDSFLQLGELNVSPDALENTVPEKKESLSLAVSATTPFKNAEGLQAKLLVVANNRMISDASLGEYDANILLLMNAVDWLSWGESLIGIRSRGATDRPLTIPAASTLSAIKLGHMVGLPLAFVLFGWWLNVQRNRRWRKLND